jgi:hypothetical protein
MKSYLVQNDRPIFPDVPIRWPDAMGHEACTARHMANVPTLLCHGRYEVLKAGVHGAALGIAAVCAAYNFAAWVARRQRHSWINATLDATLVAWEVQHVRHHLNCRIVRIAPVDGRRAA